MLRRDNNPLDVSIDKCISFESIHHSQFSSRSHDTWCLLSPKPLCPVSAICETGMEEYIPITVILCVCNFTQKPRTECVHL